MSRRRPRPCNKPGCGKLSTTGYCEDHKPESGWFNTSKASRHERGYGTAWVKRRQAILKRDKHLCQPCKRNGYLTKANAVDHITPKSQGGTDEPENLQAICNECHAIKTNRESRV